MPELQILVLRQNKFYGPIWHPRKFGSFESLRFMDLSFNNFSGSLPSEYFINWVGMIQIIDLMEKFQAKLVICRL